MKGRKTKKMNVMNGKGSPLVAGAMDKTPGFKAGGSTKAKDGGMADGMAAAGRADRKPRAAKRAAGGRTPYSSGSKTKTPAPAMGPTNLGHEGERPPVG